MHFVTQLHHTWCGNLTLQCTVYLPCHERQCGVVQSALTMGSEDTGPRSLTCSVVLGMTHICLILLTNLFSALQTNQNIKACMILLGYNFKMLLFSSTNLTLADLRFSSQTVLSSMLLYYWFIILFSSLGQIFLKVLFISTSHLPSQPFIPTYPQSYPIRIMHMVKIKNVC